MTTGRQPFIDAADVLIRESGCTIRSYRTGLNGCAYTRDDDWGIEVPHPHGPVAFAVFAHEVGHQRLHRTDRPARWQEEIEAWDYALAQFDRFGLPGYAQAAGRAATSIRWAVQKALRRSRRPDDLADRIRAAFPHWSFDVRVVERWNQAVRERNAQLTATGTSDG